MALSKCRKGGLSDGSQKWTSAADDEQTLEGILAGLAPSLFHRPLRPFLELAMDARDLGLALYSKVAGDDAGNAEAEEELLRASSLPGRAKRLQQDLADLPRELGLPGEACVLLPLGLTAALLLGGVGGGMDLAAVGKSVAGTVPILVKAARSSVTLSSDALCVMSSTVLLTGCASVYFRHPGVEFRVPMKIGAGTLFCSAVGHLLMLTMHKLHFDLGGVLYGIFGQSAEALGYPICIKEPMYLGHLLIDSLTVPILIRTIGIIGCVPHWSNAAPVVSAVFCGASLVGSEVALVRSHQALLLLGSSCFFVWSHSIAAERCSKIRIVSHQNAIRAATALDLMTVAWGTTIWLQVARWAGYMYVTPAGMIALTDLLLQLGTVHMIVRCPRAITLSGQFSAGIGLPDWSRD
eukprot:TRINITY_DN107349_c0_g1_i1.p1 TRINITY_DN107349_c0_g1~~TRINITY_DN107349_c0_g1_i1.p1  ORF type:complete len:408 (+),score=52.71 TRINITY_DN107349_c0_g1_i1:40-1263(+)